MSDPLEGPPDEVLSVDDARRLAQAVIESGDVIRLKRLGAAPYLRYTPYRNHRGATVRQWSCISFAFVAMPDRTLVTYPRIVRPWELEDWEINQIFTPWVVSQLTKTWRGRIEVLPVDESPFAGIGLEWEAGR